MVSSFTSSAEKSSFTSSSAWSVSDSIIASSSEGVSSSVFGVGLGVGEVVGGDGGWG